MGIEAIGSVHGNKTLRRFGHVAQKEREATARKYVHAYTEVEGASSKKEAKKDPVAWECMRYV